MRRAGIAVVALAVVALTACGAGSKRLTEAELQSRIQAICLEYQHRADRELESVETDPRLATTSSRDVARFSRELEHVVTLVGGQLRDLRALRPPVARSAEYSAALRSYERLRGMLSQAARAARRGDRHGIAVAAGRVDASYRAIQGFHFNDCG